MSKYIHKLFIRTYKYYKSGGEMDSFYTAAFVLSIALATLVNLILSIIFYYTKWEFLAFHPKTTGPFLLLPIIGGMIYFYKNKNEIILNNEDSKKGIDWFMLSFLFSIIAFWAIAAFIYRYQNLGY